MLTYIEKELEFTFPEGTKWKELDVQGKRLPKNMSLVDLVIERENDCLLVEIKDPSHTMAPEKERNKYLKRLSDGSVLNEELTPKARNSYIYQHLMNRDSKPFIYIVLLGLEVFSEEIQHALLSNFSDRLTRNIRNESYEAWKREHIRQCIVMSIDTWNKQFPDWPIVRVPTVRRATA